MTEDAPRPDWARGAGAWSVTTDASGAAVRSVLLRSWPPGRPTFREDKGATTEEHDGRPVHVASPEAGRRSIERFHARAALMGTKPKASVHESVVRAPVAEVLKLRCATCHGVAAFYVTWAEAATLAQMLDSGRWLPSVLPNACACAWSAWPDASGFRQQLGTALSRGLSGRHAGVKVEAAPR